MTITDIILKKRDGHALTEDEIEFVIKDYSADRIPDYQISALLMAIFFQDMNDEETVTLTRLMRDSGIVMDFSHLAAPKVDKHSTGGVGDKISIILAPLMAAAGIHVPMISGRSLAHTGGTLDKLDSIPGFKTQLPLSKFRRLTEVIGTCLIGQTEEICPADRRIYALRDVTGTVPSMSLICASILSKKLAEGIDALVLDVKVGSGAIFPDTQSAEKLAQRLVRTAKHFELNTIALLTDMSQPLGNAIGNWIEVLEAIEVLKGSGPVDTRRLTLALGAAMLVASRQETDFIDAEKKLTELLHNGAAWKKFLEIVNAQGGEVEFVQHPERYSKPKYTREIYADQSGYVAQIDARALGRLCMSIGTGRAQVTHSVDALAGITLHKKVGDNVSSGEPLATAQSSSVVLDETIEHSIQQAFQIVDRETEAPPLLIEMLDHNGSHPVPKFVGM